MPFLRNVKQHFLMRQYLRENRISSLSKPLEYLVVVKPLIPYSLRANLTIVLRTTDVDAYLTFGLCILSKLTSKKNLSVFFDS